jgi:membrane-associated protease RseP (regulator of RpoE activity)
MKAIIASACFTLLMLTATGCASKKVAQQRGWVGGEFLVAKRRPSLFGGPVVPAFPRDLEGRHKAGVFVSGVYSNTPLAIAGFQAGDLILAVDEQPVQKLAAFHQIIDNTAPGSTISLSVYRDGQLEDRPVRVGKETYKDWHTMAMGLSLSGKWELDLIPNPDFSLIALGYSRNPQRGELHSPRNRFIRQMTAGDQKEGEDDAGMAIGEGWRTWLAIFSWGGYKSILSQEAVDSKPMAWE